MTYPPIGDYAYLSDCRGSALVSSTGSVDWCCLPRMDASPVFGRLLDWERGGWCSIQPAGGSRASRSYLGPTLVLATTFATPQGRVRVTDCLVRAAAHPTLLRVVDGLEGTVELAVAVHPRFDYGGVKPWVRQHGERLWSAVGGNDALVIGGDLDLERTGPHDLSGTVELAAGQRRRLSIAYWAPEDIDPSPLPVEDAAALDGQLAATLDDWWGWAAAVGLPGPRHEQVVRSALVLRGLTYAPTGAVAAAPTTSLPETLGGSRNWDYRYCWIRDSQFTVRSLTEVGCTEAADLLRRFIERTAAGSAESLQIMYGVGGERRLAELELELHGYAGSRPVRTGNAAAGQLQLDVFGYLLDLAWRWHQRGHTPDEEYWAFLVSLVERAARLWQEVDCGIWEMRGRPQHFVHSKVMCWAALDRGLRLAEATGRAAPVERWATARAAIRQAVEERGVCPERGVFVQAFGSGDLDAAALLIPTVGFVAVGDERMRRTADALVADLAGDGLLRRYLSDDCLPGTEGAFLACTFWLAEVLAGQQRPAEASRFYDRALATANDLGLFAEECSASGELLGNFPQAMTHLSHIAAAVAMSRGGSV